MNYSPQLSKPRRLRQLLESAERLAKEMRDEVPMDSQAYDDMDYLLDGYLDQNMFQQLVIAEDSYNEQEDRKAAEDYNAPTWGAP